MKKTFYLAMFLTMLSGVSSAQDYEFKDLKQTHIKGASRLTAPKFLMAGDSLISAGKLGQAAPAVYDWDGDGKMDLLVGEFGPGEKANIMVYKNTGTNKKPVYSSDWFYAKDKTGELMFIGGS